MNFAAQVEHEDDLTCLRFDIGNNFIDQRCYAALFRLASVAGSAQTAIHPQARLTKIATGGFAFMLVGDLPSKPNLPLAMTDDVAQESRAGPLR